MLQFKFIDKEIEYDGSQLSPHWIYRNYDLEGDAMVSFIGSCNVKVNDLVDLADARRKEPIYSPKMLHFLSEIFDENLALMVHRQRLFIITIKEELEERGAPGRIIRKGDDLFHIGIAGVKRKLSVSIATRAIISTLMHTGLNIHTQGTPVPTAGLDELGIDPVQIATRIMERFNRELDDINLARCKVRGV